MNHRNRMMISAYLWRWGWAPYRDGRFRCGVMWLVAVLLVVFSAAGRAQAVDYVSTTNGVWTDPSIWAPAGVPGPADSATITAGTIVGLTTDTGAPVAVTVAALFVDSDPDCNTNGIPDDIELGAGSAPDCNGNFKPDECDLTSGVAQDCNSNGIPDFCDIRTDFSADTDNNAVPDECSAGIRAGGDTTRLYSVPTGDGVLVAAYPPAGAGRSVTVTAGMIENRGMIAGESGGGAVMLMRTLGSVDAMFENYGAILGGPDGGAVVIAFPTATLIPPPPEQTGFAANYGLIRGGGTA